MTALQPAWFPIHLHRLPATLAGGPLAGAVVCIEWNASNLDRMYGWSAPWPAAPGERLLAFMKNWHVLSSGTPMAQANPIYFSIEGEIDFGSLSWLDSLRDRGLVSLEIFREPPNRYFDRLHGLTNDGRQLLQEMERLGLYLDITHAPEAFIMRLSGIWSGRCIASHIVCADLMEWSLFRPPNALSDEMLSACRADLYGVPFVDDIVSFRKTPCRAERRAGIRTVAEHILHLAGIVGPEKVALGPDFFDYARYLPEGIEIGTVEGLESVEGLAALFTMLLDCGMTKEEAEGVFWRNACRVFSAFSPICEKMV